MRPWTHPAYRTASIKTADTRAAAGRCTEFDYCLRLLIVLQQSQNAKIQSRPTRAH